MHFPACTISKNSTCCVFTWFIRVQCCVGWSQYLTGAQGRHPSAVFLPPIMVCWKIHPHPGTPLTGGTIICRIGPAGPLQGNLIILIWSHHTLLLSHHSCTPKSNMGPGPVLVGSSLMICRTRWWFLMPSCYQWGVALPLPYMRPGFISHHPPIWQSRDWLDPHPGFHQNDLVTCGPHSQCDLFCGGFLMLGTSVHNLISCHHAVLRRTVPGTYQLSVAPPLCPPPPVYR